VKRRKKVAIDANKRFAGIETIIKTQQVLGEQKALWERRERAEEARK
jgi:hypothetical protein